MVLLSSLALLAPQTPPPPKPGFTVIAPAAWTKTLEPFVGARSADFAVEMVTLEDVLAKENGVDAPERIKQHLFRAWKERGSRYALLVGDADTFPVRFMVLDRWTEPAFHYAFYASDLYYADVADEQGSFDDWNAEQDGFHARYFGEVRGETNKDGRIDFDRVSYVPELAVGRWPVSTAEELAAVVAKTLSWSAPKERAFFVHADGWIDARARVNGMAAVLEARGIAVEKQLYGDERAGPHAAPAEPPAEVPAGSTSVASEPVAVPTPASVLAALRRDPLYVFHLGHGTEETWHACLGPLERDALASVRPMVFMSVGCGTAHFVNEPPYAAYVDELGVDHPGTNAGEVFTAPPPPPSALQPEKYDTTGLGERLLRMPAGGAVAYVGCNTGAQPCAVTLMDGFVRSLGSSGTRRVGDAWRDALAHYCKAERLVELAPDAGWYPPSIFFQGMKFMLFGDPTLAVR
jgi:hypothetical protein